MALELPGWLTDAFNLIGLPWPGIDEDQLRAWAASIRQFANDVTGNSSQVNQTMRDLADSSRSSVITGVARQYESHHRLLTELHGPMDDFAQALDYAADAIVAQKWVVIGAASALAAEFTATQIGAIFTLGADEAALPEEIISTQTIVKFALKDLEAVVIGRLINWAAQELSDRLSHSIVTLANDTWSVRMEAQGLKVTYEKISGAARELRGHADEAEHVGGRAHAENTGRNIEDSSGGGGWTEVISALKRGLLDIADDLFKTLPGAIAEILRNIAETLEKLAAKLRRADSGADEPPPGSLGKVTPSGSSDEELKAAVDKRYTEITDAESPGYQSIRQRGPVLTGVRDRTTGRIELAQNGGDFPDNLHPSLAERVNNLPSKHFYPGGSGVHGEVHALNKLLWTREAAGLPTGIDDSFAFYSVRLRGSARGDPIARCEGCEYLTDGGDDLAK